MGWPGRASWFRSDSSVDEAAPLNGPLFFDDFPGSSVDPSKWTVFNRLGDQANSELNAVLPANVTVANSILTITQKHEDVTIGDSITAPKLVHYTSGQIQQATTPFLYGTIEYRALIAGGTGPWPVLWMLGYLWQPNQAATADEPTSNWPVGGWCEIDVAEFLNGSRTLLNTVAHWTVSGGTVQETLPYDATTRFMKYRLQWTATALTWSVDPEDGSGYQTLRTITDTSKIPNVPMYVVINCAVGGIGGGTPDPATFPTAMQIDWVRVTQP